MLADILTQQPGDFTAAKFYCPQTQLVQSYSWEDIRGFLNSFTYMSSHPMIQASTDRDRYDYCCYDHRNFTATAVVSYLRNNTAISVFYSVLGGLSGRCLLKTATHFRRVIWSLHERIARSVGDKATLHAPQCPLPHSQTTVLPGQQRQSKHCT